MKGITHFLFGIAMATFFSIALDAAVTQKALIILLGGIFGVLPDTLDFRFQRYIQKHTYEVEPDPHTLNAQNVADTIAYSINQAYETGKPVLVKLHTQKINQEFWRRYNLIIDPVNKTVTVKIGGWVTWADTPDFPGTVSEPEPVYTAHFYPDVEYNYDQETKVTILSGPDYEFVRDENKVRVDFIPFHRKWTHSFTFAFLFGVIGFILYGFSSLGFAAFGIIVVGFAGHVLVDQLGMLGGNLFFPLTKKRTPGLCLCRSADAIPNFSTNYFSLMLILWNLDAFNLTSKLKMPLIDMFGLQTSSFAIRYIVGLTNYVLVYIVIPLVIVYFFYYILYKRKVAQPTINVAHERTIETLKETEELIEN